MTKASATVVVPAIPAMSDVAETLPISSTTRKVQPAENEADRENELDNDSTKVKLLRTAMSRGDADAPVSLANLYLEGKEVSRSCDQAVSLLESAAAKANARARNRLAAMYEIGTCVERDRVQAYRWLSAALAVDHDNVWAQENLDQTWREMTPEERTMAEAYR
jgi:TPR repeat protein